MARSTELPSRASKHSEEATRSGNKGDVEGGDMTDGEFGAEVGSRYSARLLERSNKSLNRNAGPSRPCANDGEIPVVDQGVRKTGRV